MSGSMYSLQFWPFWGQFVDFSGFDNINHPRPFWGPHLLMGWLLRGWNSWYCVKISSTTCFVSFKFNLEIAQRPNVWPFIGCMISIVFFPLHVLFSLITISWFSPFIQLVSIWPYHWWDNAFLKVTYPHVNCCHRCCFCRVCCHIIQVRYLLQAWCFSCPCIKSSTNFRSLDSLPVSCCLIAVCGVQPSFCLF